MLFCFVLVADKGKYYNVNVACLFVFLHDRIHGLKNENVQSKVFKTVMLQCRV